MQSPPQSNHDSPCAGNVAPLDRCAVSWPAATGNFEIGEILSTPFFATAEFEGL